LTKTHFRAESFNFFVSNSVIDSSRPRNDQRGLEAAGSRADAGLPPRGTPKNYLMAWLLVMLKDLDLHGYEIMKALKENFAVATDPGTVYRALRQLERSGYIASWWDSREQGPARRMYTLTEAGSDALKIWTAGLQQYRTNLDAFFNLVTGSWSNGRSDD
jgi:poly-beta-hydroxybutyrate-responsive repressor